MEDNPDGKKPTTKANSSYREILQIRVRLRLLQNQIIRRLGLREELYQASTPAIKLARVSRCCPSS